MNKSYKFVWGRDVWAMTVFTVASLLFVGIILFVSQVGLPWYAYLVYSVAVIGLVIGCWLTEPMYLTVSNNEVIISRRLGQVILPIIQIKSVCKVNGGLFRFARMVGNGGLFGYTGVYINRKTGNVRMYATEMSNLVFIELMGRKVVVSCRQADDFIKTVEGLMRK